MLCSMSSLSSPHSPARRREVAERLLATTTVVPGDLESAIHELRIHQVQLEMQNEELRRATVETARYAELFDSAPVGYVILDRAGSVDQANHTAAHLLGLAWRRLIGQPFTAFVSSSDQDAFYLYLHSVRRSEAPETIRLRLRRSGGAPFWAQVDSRSGVLGEGDIVWVIFTDITANVETEEALASSEAALRTLVETMADAAILIDPVSGRILDTNAAASTLYGYSRDELLAMRNTDLSAEPDEMRQLTAGGPTADDTLVYIPVRLHRRKDGAVFLVEITGCFSTRDGRRILTVCIRDITERANAGEELCRRYGHHATDGEVAPPPGA